MKKGEIIHLDYEAWIAENNELFDTTKEKLAKEHEIFNEKAIYKPLPIIIGGGNVVKGLDDHLLKAQVNKQYTINLEPIDGFGERDPKLVEMHSKREILRLPEFKKGDKEPYIGMKLVMNNKVGWISAITAGRVRVDFNNRYAGHKLKYVYKITDYADKQDKRVKSILEMHYGKIEDFEIKLSKNDAMIKLPDTCKYDLGWFQAKYRVVTDLREYAGIKNVQFIEEYLKKVEPSKDEKEMDKEKEEKKDKGEEVGKNKKESDKEKEEKVPENKQEKQDKGEKKKK